MSAPLYRIDQASYRYGRVPALRGLSLEIHGGQRIALLGANGSGKSTCLRMLDALCFPDSGLIEFQGEPLTEARFSDDRFAYDFRRRVGLVFQSPDIQLFNPTVFDEVAFGPLQMRWTKGEVRDRVEAMLESLRLAELRDRAPHHLSGGEKKKVALASVLVLNPEVLLLDEPTAALDPRSQTQILEILAGWTGGNRTVITATHDLHVLEDIADVCRIFEQGVITAEGTPRAVLSNEELLRRANLIHSHRHGQHTHTHTHPKDA